MNKDRKSAVKRGALAVVTSAALIALIGGTYARYTTTKTAEGSVDIAKWAVKVNEADATSNTFDLNFSVNENDDVVNDKIAPGGTATAYVEVDLTGTEVSVDFDCELNTEAEGYAESVLNTNSKVKLTMGDAALEGETSNMTLNGAKTGVTVGSEAMSGKVKIPVTLTWENDETNNADDTSTGAEKTDVKIPVTVTVQQHIAD